MTVPALANAADRLARVNTELSELFGCPPAALRTGATNRGLDGLVICGLLGGKDAGKSTLINALADETVSVDTEVVGEGTTLPIAYAHEEAVDTVRRRFTAGGSGVAHRVVTHRVDVIRRLVLVDLPDIDSTFHEHVDTVRQAVERLDRVVWVFDPKKGDDRAITALLPRVVRDPANVYCVLNKFDETLKDDTNGAGAEAFWTNKREWFSRCTESLGLDPDERHRFLISARYAQGDAFARAVSALWFGQEDHALDPPDRALVAELADRASREITRLKTDLLAPLTEEEARRIKHGNEASELAVNIADVRAHYDLDRTARRLGDLLEDFDRQISHEFDGHYVGTVARRLAGWGKSDADLARSLMSDRVERWPILPVLYWPLGGIARWLGRWFTPRAAHTAGAAPADLLRVQGRGVEHRAAALRERVELRLAAMPEGLLRDIDLASAASRAAAVESAVADRADRLDEEVLAECRAGDRRPRRLPRASLWFVLFWFPLLQPLLKGGLELAVKQGLGGGLNAALTVVTAFGAMGLLKGLAAAGVVYVIVLAVMYARSVRDVRRVRGATSHDPLDPGPYGEEVGRILADEIRAPLREHIERVAGRVTKLQGEIEALESAAG